MRLNTNKRSCQNRVNTADQSISDNCFAQEWDILKSKRINDQISYKGKWQKERKRA